MYKTAPAETLRNLEIALETTLLLSQEGVSIPTLAERIYDGEPDLMEQLKRPWMLSRLEWMLYRKQDRLPGGEQTMLPGFPALPTRATLKNRQRPFLMQTNVKQLEEFRDILGKTKGRRFKIVDRLIALMVPYAEKRPGITVAEVMHAEFRKIQSE